MFFGERRLLEVRLNFIKECRDRFELTAEQSEYLKLCEAYLIGRRCLIFSIAKKIKGLKVLIKNYKSICQRKDRKSLLMRFRRKVFIYFRYLFC